MNIYVRQFVLKSYKVALGNIRRTKSKFKNKYILFLRNPLLLAVPGKTMLSLCTSWRHVR